MKTFGRMKTIERGIIQTIDIVGIIGRKIIETIITVKTSDR